MSHTLGMKYQGLKKIIIIITCVYIVRVVGQQMVPQTDDEGFQHYPAPVQCHPSPTAIDCLDKYHFTLISPAVSGILCYSGS